MSNRTRPFLSIPISSIPEPIQSYLRIYNVCSPFFFYSSQLRLLHKLSLLWFSGFLIFLPFFWGHIPFAVAIFYSISALLFSTPYFPFIHLVHYLSFPLPSVPSRKVPSFIVSINSFRFPFSHAIFTIHLFAYFFLRCNFHPFPHICFPFLSLCQYLSSILLTQLTLRLLTPRSHTLPDPYFQPFLTCCSRKADRARS